MSLKITKAYKINQYTIFRTKPVIIKGMSPAVNEGFPFAQTLFSMRKMIPQKIDLPRTMRKKAQREVLLFSLLRLTLNRAAEAFIVEAWMDPLMGGRAAHSDFCQSTDDRADSLRRHRRKRALCCCRLRYERQRWRFWKALSCRKDRQNGWAAKKSCRSSSVEIQLQQTQITAKGMWLQQYNSREMEVEDASRWNALFWSESTNWLWAAGMFVLKKQKVYC